MPAIDRSLSDCRYKESGPWDESGDSPGLLSTPKQAVKDLALSPDAAGLTKNNHFQWKIHHFKYKIHHFQCNVHRL